MLPSRPLALDKRLHRAQGAVLSVAVAILATTIGCEPPQDATAAGALPEDAPLVPADAEALAAYLKPAISQNPDAGRLFLMEDAVAAPGAPSAPSSDPTAFSTTTLQTDGVDEADLVKFDGETLFVARQPNMFYLALPLPTPLPVAECGAEPCAAASTESVLEEEGTDFEIVGPEIGIFAASSDPAEAVEISSIVLEDGGTIHGMMLLPGSDANPARLVVVTTSPWGWGGAIPAFDLARPIAYGEGYVRLWIFDVSDPTEPTLMHRSRFDGNLIAVRRVGEDLILVTRTTPYLPALPVEPEDGIDPRLADVDVQALLPRLWIELPDDGASPRPLMPPEHCFVPRATAEAEASLYYYHPTLVSITMLDLGEPSSLESICVAGRADRIFSSTRALYLASTYWGEESSTVVHKFAYTDGGPEFRGSGRAEGMPGGSNPDFGLGETGDAFGIMTMITHPDTFERSARLTLLAEATGASRRLVEASHLPNEREPASIGKPGEQLYAVRFLGDRVYAVTFRRIDPLYVIDVEDPRNPFIAGELEIPGFSDSLHPITGDLLLGVGKDSIADGGVDWFQGVKVELFDVSNPSAPASVDAIVIGERGSETAARTEHHAFSALDVGDGTSRVALPISVADGDAGAGETGDPRTWHAWSRTGLHLFEVDHDAPSLHAAGALIIAEAGDEGGIESTWRDRSRIQGDAVHYVHEGEVWSADWSAPEDPVGPQ